MKKATMFVMTLLVLVSTGLAQSRESIRTIDLRSADPNPNVFRHGSSTKQTAVNSRTTREVFMVQVWTSGMVDPNSVESDENSLEVRTDLLSGEKDYLIGKIHIRPLTGAGQLVLSNGPRFNESDPDGDRLVIPLYQIQNVKVMHNGELLASGSF